MCLICVEMTKNKLTSKAARRNLGELYVDMENDHVLEVLKKIWDQENEEYQEYWDDLNAFWGDAD